MAAPGPCLPPPNVPGGSWRCNPVTGECLLDCLTGYQSPAPVAVRCCTTPLCSGWHSTNIGLGCSRTDCQEAGGQRSEEEGEHDTDNDIVNEEEKETLTRVDVKKLEIPEEAGDTDKELEVAPTEETMGDGGEENEIRIFDKEVIEGQIPEHQDGDAVEASDDVIYISREGQDIDLNGKTESDSEQKKEDDKGETTPKDNDGKNRTTDGNKKDKGGANLASYEEMFVESNEDLKDAPGDAPGNESELEKETIEHKSGSSEDTSLEKELQTTEQDDSNNDDSNEQTSLEKEIKNGDSEADKDFEEHDESIESSSSGEGEDGSGNHFVTEEESSYNGYGYDYSTIKYQGQSSNFSFTRKKQTYDFLSELESEESSGTSEVVNDFSRFRKTIHSKTESDEETEQSRKVEDIR